MNRPRIFLICLALWSASFVLYSPSLDSGFVNYDDVTILRNHPNLYNETSFAASIREIVWGYFPREEPLILRDITWALDSRLFGLKNPFGYHFGNILLHSSNVVLLFLFLWLTSRRIQFSLLVAITFAALAIHVEPVAWIMGRKDLLVTFFILLTLIFQAAYCRSNEPGKRRGLYLATIVSTTAALFSKINALPLFAVLGAYQLFFPVLSGTADQPVAVRKRMPAILRQFVPHLLISLGVYFWYSHIIGSFGVLEREIATFSKEHITSLLAFTPLVLAIYLKLVFVPLDYAVKYPWPTIFTPLTTWQVAVSLCIGAAIVWITLWLYRKRKDLFFYWVSFFLLMIPYLNIVYIGIWIANRYLYFSVFCILCLAGELFLFFMKRRLARIIGLAIWICFIGLNLYQTVAYQIVWKNEFTLWHYENGRQNPSLISFAGLSYAYMQMGRGAVEDEDRSKFFARADTILDRGLAQYGEWRNQKRDENVYKLYYLRALLSGYRDESPARQLQHYKKAYAINPKDARLNRKLSELYYRLARNTDDTIEKEALAVLALQLFEQYIEVTWHDPVLRKINARTLEDVYAKEFPFLREEIEGIKARLP